MCSTWKAFTPYQHTYTHAYSLLTFMQAFYLLTISLCLCLVWSVSESFFFSSCSTLKKTLGCLFCFETPCSTAFPGTGFWRTNRFLTAWFQVVCRTCQYCDRNLIYYFSCRLQYALLKCLPICLRTNHTNNIQWKILGFLSIIFYLIKLIVSVCVTLLKDTLSTYNVPLSYCWDLYCFKLIMHNDKMKT